MENTKRLQDKEKAYDIIKNIKNIIDPKVDFILTRKIGCKKEYIIGVTENSNLANHYIIKTFDKTKVLQIENLCFSFNKILDECVERYILSSIMNNYHISYISLFMHINLWSFIEAYLNDLDLLIGGVKKYLRYCKYIGLTKEIIDYYDETTHEELYAIFLNGYFENYEILLAQLIGKNNLLLGYQIQSRQIIYTVVIFDTEENKKTYKDFYSKLDSAKIDFKRLLYELSINYYNQLEKTIDEITEQFINFTEGVL